MTDTSDLTAELYLRTFSTAADRQREVVGRLETLADEGIIDTVTTDHWGDRIDLASGDRYVDAFYEFQEWADQRGISVTPPFAIRTYQSAFTGESCDVLVTPVAFLATYVDGRLDGLFPHQDGQTVRTIDDFLGRLETSGPIGMATPEDAAAIR